MKNSNNKNKKGFTLIELLAIVIIIIGLIIGFIYLYGDKFKVIVESFKSFI